MNTVVYLVIDLENEYSNKAFLSKDNAKIYYAECLIDVGMSSRYNDIVMTTAEISDPPQYHFMQVLEQHPLNM